MSDSQFNSMGQGVGLSIPNPGGLPPVSDLVIPPTGIGPPDLQGAAQPVALLARLPHQGVSMFPQHNLFMPQAVAPAPGPGRHHSVLKAEHKNSKAARRGPMDEMRQLVRILVKLMPDSARFLTVPDEGGGGNRVKEEHIKDYLNKVLGRSYDLSDEAPPYPEWGLSNGWAAYLSQLFTWAKGSHVTADQALKCARRLPGRSWETLTEELEKLRLCPAAWPLPLRKEAVRAVQKRYEETGQLPPQRASPPSAQAVAMPPGVLPVGAGAIPVGATAIPPGAIPHGMLFVDPSLANLAALAAGVSAGMPAAMLGAIPTAAPAAAAPMAAGPAASGPEAEHVGQKRSFPSGEEEGALQQPPTSAAIAAAAAAALAPNTAAQPQPSLIRPAMATPAPAPSVAAPVSAAHGYYQGPAPKRRRKAPVTIDSSAYQDCSELELTNFALTIVHMAMGPTKVNTTPPEHLGQLAIARDMLSRAVGHIVASSASAHPSQIDAGPAGVAHVQPQADVYRQAQVAAAATAAALAASGTAAPPPATSPPPPQAAAPAAAPPPTTTAPAAVAPALPPVAIPAATAAPGADLAAQLRAAGLPISNLHLGLDAAGLRMLQQSGLAGLPASQLVQVLQQAGHPAVQQTVNTGWTRVAPQAPEPVAAGAVPAGAQGGPQQHSVAVQQPSATSAPAPQGSLTTVQQAPPNQAPQHTQGNPAARPLEASLLQEPLAAPQPHQPHQPQLQPQQPPQPQQPQQQQAQPAAAQAATAQQPSSLPLPPLGGPGTGTELRHAAPAAHADGHGAARGRGNGDGPDTAIDVDAEPEVVDMTDAGGCEGGRTRGEGAAAGAGGAGAPEGGIGGSGSSGAGAAMRSASQGAAVVRPTVQDAAAFRLGGNVQPGKEPARDAASKPGEVREVRVGTSGAFKTYDRAGGGLDALAAAAEAAAGVHSPGEREGAGTPSPRAPTQPLSLPLPLPLPSQQQYHPQRCGSEATESRGGGGGPTASVSRQGFDQRRTETKSVARSVATIEGVDETTSRVRPFSKSAPAESLAEVEGPGGVEPASSSAPPRTSNLAHALRSRVHQHMEQAALCAEERQQQHQQQHPPAPPQQQQSQQPLYNEPLPLPLPPPQQQQSSHAQQPQVPAPTRQPSQQPSGAPAPTPTSSVVASPSAAIPGPAPQQMSYYPPLVGPDGLPLRGLPHQLLQYLPLAPQYLGHPGYVVVQHLPPYMAPPPGSSPLPGHPLPVGMSPPGPLPPPQ